MKNFANLNCSIRADCLKSSTLSLIRYKKKCVQAQSQRSLAFLKRSKTAEIRSFFLESEFLMCFRFVATTSFNKSDLVRIMYLNGAEMLPIEDFSACSLLVDNEVDPFFWISKLLASGSIYLVRTLDEKTHFNLLRSIITLEENTSAVAMLSLIFVKDARLLVDVQSHTVGGLQARNSYKMWDSKESILIELIQTNLVVICVLLNTLELELSSNSSVLSKTQII